MIDRKQRDRVIKLFEDGVKISEISKEVGVSRQSVYNIIRDDLKTDPEILGLEKELKKTRLKEQIEELKKPKKREDELANVKMIMKRLISKVQLLWAHCKSVQNIKDFTFPQYCIYCGGELKYYYYEKKDIDGYKCKDCKKEFPSPPSPY